MKAFNSYIIAVIIAIVILSFNDVTSAFSVASVSRKRASQNGVRLHDERRDDKVDDVDITRRRRRRHRNLEHWGFERQLDVLDFPSSFEEVADEVCDAIEGTLCGLQRPDPNVVSNAMHQSVLDYRPTHPLASAKQRWSRGDDANAKPKKSRNSEPIPLRMGVEIDGAGYLSKQSTFDEGRSMRILALHIANRLSRLPMEMNAHNSPLRRKRSVAVYFNTVEQSLLASRELNRWKIDHEYTGNISFDDMHIYCLGQDPLPLKGKSQRQQNTNDFNTNTDFKESIILIVKPTDYDTTSHERHHPTIQANVVDKLQTLLFQAAASCIPAVVLSPRLSELAPMQQSSFQGYKRTGPLGFEQSGFQISSTYGGVEPPVGPTSWLLRDLVPPIYVWVGCAFNIHGEHLRWRSIAELHRQQQQYNTDSALSRLGEYGNEKSYSFYSRMALRLSAMDPGHSWNMFAVKERINLLPKMQSRRSDGVDQMERDVSYHYIGSTVAARGRPSSRIMSDVFEEFIEHSESK